MTLLSANGIWNDDMLNWKRGDTYQQLYHGFYAKDAVVYREFMIAVQRLQSYFYSYAEITLDFTIIVGATWDTETFFFKKDNVILWSQIYTLPFSNTIPNEWKQTGAGYFQGSVGYEFQNVSLTFNQTLNQTFSRLVCFFFVSFFLLRWVDYEKRGHRITFVNFVCVSNLKYKAKKNKQQNSFMDNEFRRSNLRRILGSFWHQNDNSFSFRFEFVFFIVFLFFFLCLCLFV